MSHVITITFDLDKKCFKCQKPGATGNGMCLKCCAEIVRNKLKKKGKA